MCYPLYCQWSHSCIRRSRGVPTLVAIPPAWWYYVEHWTRSHWLSWHRWWWRSSKEARRTKWKHPSLLGFLLGRSRSTSPHYHQAGPISFRSATRPGFVCATLLFYSRNTQRALSKCNQSQSFRGKYSVGRYALATHISVLLSAKIEIRRWEPSRRLQIKEGYLHYQQLWEDNVNICNTNASERWTIAHKSTEQTFRYISWRYPSASER